MKMILARVVLLTAFISCGSQSSVQLVLSGDVAFGDATVQDVVFTFENVPTTAGFLDQDQNGVPDRFIYPTDCTVAKAPSCGFSAQTGEVTVGELPLGFQYSVLVELRNAIGDVLYSGTSAFNNLENSNPVAILVQ